MPCTCPLRVLVAGALIRVLNYVHVSINGAFNVAKDLWRKAPDLLHAPGIFLAAPVRLFVNLAR